MAANSRFTACLNDLTIARLCDLVRRQAEQPPVDFSVVLPEAGCGIRVALVGAPELDREARTDHVSGQRFRGMAKRLQHVPLAQMPPRHDVAEIADRGRRHITALEAFNCLRRCY